MGGRAPEFARGYVLVITPNQATPQLTKLLLYVDGATFEIRRATFVDARQNRNLIDFSNANHHPQLSAQQFVVSVPPGTTVVGAAPPPTTCP